MKKYINGGIILEKEQDAQGTPQNQVKVNNNISLSFHFGDSLNLLALLAGVFFIKTISKQYKTKKLKKDKP
jgi:hypothetical protein